jgi:RimJ/RimL family protein N-acetyltransferase
MTFQVRTPARADTSGWSDAVLLLDGSIATLRPLRPDDRERLSILFASCSATSLYTRFFSTGRAMVEPHLDHLFDRASDALTYVVEQGDRIIGVADVETCDPSTSEIAFLVADDRHGLGIATHLLERAAADAERGGVAWFVADVLAVNHPMLAVFTDAGYRLERHDDRSEASLRMSTETTAATRAAAAARQASARLHQQGQS